MRLSDGKPRQAAMAFAPIPRRYRPLTWRRPRLVWAPAALVLALGWPAMILREEPALLTPMLIAGAGALIIGLMTLGASHLVGRPPTTRRGVLAHFLIAGSASSLCLPFAYVAALDWLARTEHGLIDAGLAYDAALATAPLALIIGLPTAVFAGLMLSLVAMVKPRLQSWAEAYAPSKPNLPVIVTGTTPSPTHQRLQRTEAIASDAEPASR